MNMMIFQFIPRNLFIIHFHQFHSQQLTIKLLNLNHIINFLFYMNQPATKNQSLLASMSADAQRQVLLLIKRLGDQKQAKQQYQNKCLRYEQQIIELQKIIQKLHKQNANLKQKWQSSFSMISKVRQNFSGSKSMANQNAQTVREKSKIKKLRFNKDQADWSEEQADSRKQNQQVVHNKIVDLKENSFKQNNNRNKNCNNNELGQRQQHIESKHNFQTTRVYPQSPNQTQTSRPHKPPFNPNSTQRLNSHIFDQSQFIPNSTSCFSASKNNQMNRSNKKLQIQCLKQQIENMAHEIKIKQTEDLSLMEKVKKCEQIKNRYRNNNSKDKLMINFNKKQVPINQNESLVLSEYYSPKKEHNSTKPQQFEQNYSQFSQILQTPSSQSFIQPYNQNKQQITQRNDNYQVHKQNMVSGNIIVSQPSQYYHKSEIKKTATKPIQNSFYDDGLLDLIQEINR